MPALHTLFLCHLFLCIVYSCRRSLMACFLHAPACTIRNISSQSPPQASPPYDSLSWGLTWLICVVLVIIIRRRYVSKKKGEQRFLYPFKSFTLFLCLKTNLSFLPLYLVTEDAKMASILFFQCHTNVRNIYEVCNLLLL